MELLYFSQPQFISFLMVFARITIVLFMLPVLGSEMIPVTVKIGLSLVISFALSHAVVPDPALFPAEALMLPVVIVAEVLVGLVLSLVIRLFFAAVQMAGQVMGFQIGFSMINVVDPQSGGQVSIMDQFGYWVALVVFLLLDGHHVLIAAMAQSFKIIPFGGFVMSGALAMDMVAKSAAMFVLGIKIGAPVITALFFVSAAFGITAKFAPQMNVLVMAFPVKIIVGLVLFGLSLEIIALACGGFIGSLSPEIRHMLQLMAGGG